MRIEELPTTGSVVFSDVGLGVHERSHGDAGDVLIRYWCRLSLSEREREDPQLGDGAEHCHVVVGKPSRVHPDRIDPRHPVKNSVGQVALPRRDGRVLRLRQPLRNGDHHFQTGICCGHGKVHRFM